MDRKLEQIRIIGKENTLNYYCEYIYWIEKQNLQISAHNEYEQE